MKNSVIIAVLAVVIAGCDKKYVPSEDVEVVTAADGNRAVVQSGSLVVTDANGINLLVIADGSSEIQLNAPAEEVLKLMCEAIMKRPHGTLTVIHHEETKRHEVNSQ